MTIITNTPSCMTCGLSRKDCTCKQCDCRSCSKQCDDRREASTQNARQDFAEDIRRTLNQGLMEPSDIAEVLQTMTNQGNVSAEEANTIVEKLAVTYPSLRTAPTIKPKPIGPPQYVGSAANHTSSRKDTTMSKPTPLGMPTTEFDSAGADLVTVNEVAARPGKPEPLRQFAMNFDKPKKAKPSDTTRTRSGPQPLGQPTMDF